MKKTEIFAVAGEESANQYLSKIINSFKNTNPEVVFSGIGYDSLKEHGFVQVFDAKNLAVMGALEVVKKWTTIKDAFEVSLDYIKTHQPSVVLLIDFGGFNLKLAEKIKKAGIETKVIYFISPKIWAWNQKRALKVKKYVDKMCVIHPFEVDFYQKWGVEASFVGHPLLQELGPQLDDENWINEQRSKEGISQSTQVVGLLLGSRNSEIEKHFHPFSNSLRILSERAFQEGLKVDVLCIVPPSFSVEEFKNRFCLEGYNFKVTTSKEPIEKMALCDLCVVSSGTATLQLGLLGKPMAIGYIMNALTMFLAKTFVKGVKFSGLVNIILDEEVSKEFLQKDFKPDEVAEHLLNFLLNKQDFFQNKNKLLSLRTMLGEKNTYEELKNEILALC